MENNKIGSSTLCKEDEIWATNIHGAGFVSTNMFCNKPFNSLMEILQEPKSTTQQILWGLLWPNTRLEHPETDTLGLQPNNFLGDTKVFKLNETNLTLVQVSTGSKPSSST